MKCGAPSPVYKSSKATWKERSRPQNKSNQQSADQVFYGIGDALPERAKEKEKRVRELAAHMEDRKRAALFTELALYKFLPPEVMTIQAVPCDEAYFKATAGKFAEADAVIEKNKCTFVSFVTKAQFAVDPAGAERILRGHADADDLVRGLNDFAVVAAEKGDIKTALHFLDNLENLTGPGKSWGAAHIIARAWTHQRRPSCPHQVDTLPTEHQRTYLGPYWNGGSPGPRPPAGWRCN